MSIGERLREERVRLGLTQAQIAARVAMTPKAQVDYEMGRRYPDAAYLSVLAEMGFDVNYVVTGGRASRTLSAQESDLLAAYHAAPEPLRDAARRVLGAPVPDAQSPPAAPKRQKTVTVSAPGGVAVGGDMTVGARRTRPKSKG
ncbi:MAG: helix-turn-helix transcriptional regulator [Rhodocyclaceae bacterium]|nr:helix-turn-helix transcriptional regulator [Rhodocyclaceae bacterium]